MNATSAILVIGGLALVGGAAYLILKSQQEAQARALAQQQAIAASQDPSKISEERRILGGVQTSVGGAFKIVEGIFTAYGL